MLNSFFIVIREVMRLDRLHVVTVPELVIGRSDECALQLIDAAVSRSHARLVRTTTGLLVRDLGSRNGTFVNGRRIQAAELIDGGEVQINPYQLRIFFDHERAELHMAASDDSTGSVAILAALATEVERMERKLTPTERRVYEALLKGLPRKDIATLLGMKPETAHTHTTSIFRIFQVESQPLLMDKCRDRRSQMN